MFVKRKRERWRGEACMVGRGEERLKTRGRGDWGNPGFSRHDRPIQLRHSGC